MYKVLITTGSFGAEDSAPLDYLRKHCHVSLNPFGRKMTKQELLQLGQEADGIIAGTETLSAEVMTHFPNLKVISRCGSGLDNVDVAFAREKGISVFNTPYGPTLAVAELTVGLMLNLLRKTSLMDKNLRQGKWKKCMGNLLCKKKVGIIGFGRIGQTVALLLQKFGVELAYYDTLQQQDAKILFKEKNDLLHWADVITLHLSSSSHQPIIDSDALLSMRPGSWLINTARGELVDEKVLYENLVSGHLAGAALDVYSTEPYQGILTELDNVILTPHIGSYAKEGRIQMEMEAAQNLLCGFNDILRV